MLKTASPPKAIGRRDQRKVQVVDERGQIGDIYSARSVHIGGVEATDRRERHIQEVDHAGQVGYVDLIIGVAVNIARESDTTRGTTGKVGAEIDPARIVGCPAR